MATTESTNADTNAPEVEAQPVAARRAIGWSAQYVFWVVLLGAIVVATWMSASGSSAFRYAGF